MKKPLLYLLGLIPLSALPALDLPFHPEEAAVIEQIAKTEGIRLEENPKGPFKRDEITEVLTSEGIDAETLHVYGVKGIERDGAVMQFVHDEHGRIVGMTGNGPWLSNQSLLELAKLPELRLVWLDHNVIMKADKIERFSGETWTALEGGKLKDVKIGHGLDDTGTAALARIPTLERVFLTHSRVTDAGLVHFAGHPGITDLKVTKVGPKGITGKALEPIGRIPNLEVLTLAGVYLPYDGGLEYLKPLAGKLKTIAFPQTLVAPADLERLKADHPEAEILPSTYQQLKDGRFFKAFQRVAPEAVEALRVAEGSPSP